MSERHAGRPFLQDKEKRKTLQELEGKDWGEPAFSSHLVRTCHHLRRKPLALFTAEDMRIMIGQHIGLPYVVPLALELLQKDALVAGDFYEGDLLESVLKLDAHFWQTWPAFYDQLEQLISNVSRLPQELDDALQKFRAWRR